MVALGGRRRGSRKVEQISDKEWTCESSGQDGGAAMQFVGWFVKKKKKTVNMHGCAGCLLGLDCKQDGHSHLTGEETGSSCK